MLVKQVFFRSMGVWIFAGALLVVETCCAPLERNIVNEKTERAKKIMVKHLKLQLDLNLLHQESQDPKYVIGKQKTMMDKVERIVTMGMTFYSTIQTFMNSDLDSLYDMDGNFDGVLKDVPSPPGVYAVKITRMKVFGAYLHGLGGGRGETVLTLAKRVAGSKDIEEIRGLLQTIIAKFGELPFIHVNERFTDLPKTTKQVEWQEVMEAFNEMKSSLRDYCQLPSHVEKSELVVHQFLQWANGHIDTSILEVLDNLYKKHRFYRLAASETHNIYVADPPGALDFTRRLRNTIRRLNRFASLMQSVTEKEDFKKNFEYMSMQAVVFRLKEWDTTKEIWKPFVVQNLFDVLSHPPGRFTELQSLGQGPHEYMGRLTKLFAEVEGSTGIFKTFNTMVTRNIDVEDEEIRRNYFADLRYLVALLDTRAEKLRQIIQSEEAKNICDDLKNFSSIPMVDSLLKRGGSLCTEVQRAIDIDRTFYSCYHIFNPTCLETAAAKKEQIAEMANETFPVVSKEEFRMKITMDNLIDIVSPQISE